MAFIIPAAITGAAALMNYMGQQEANDVARRNLEETRRNNEAQLRFAKAGRTDAYGNKLNFDEALNQWLTQLTPEQQSLALAGEREQRLGLTEDAARNRLIQAMQQATGRQANDLLRRDLTSYGAQGTPNEAGTRAALTRLLSQATPISGPRMSTGGLGGLVIGNANLGRGGTARLAQILLQARQGALGETGTRIGQRGTALGSAGVLSQLSGGGAPRAPQMPTVAQEANARQDAAMQQLLATMQNSQSNQARAYEALIKAKPQLDLRGSASLYSALSKNPPVPKDATGKPEPISSATSFGNDSGSSDSGFTAPLWLQSGMTYNPNSGAPLSSSSSPSWLDPSLAYETSTFSMPSASWF